MKKKRAKNVQQTEMQEKHKKTGKSMQGFYGHKKNAEKSPKKRKIFRIFIQHYFKNLCYIKF